MNEPPRLLGEHDPDPVWISDVAGSASDFVLICDHAGREIPAVLGDLGLQDHERERHIAWDIGVEGLGRALSQSLGALCIGQRYSRLVIDCNRDPASAESIAEISGGIGIPGNRDLDDAARTARRNEIFAPYHARIAAEIDTRETRGRASVLVLLHSFTPVWENTPRPWQIGVLHDRDTRLARPLLRALSSESGLIVGDNQPYSSEDGTDFSLAHHAQRRGLRHVELEIRQDLIDDAAGQRDWALRLARLLPLALGLSGGESRGE